MVGSNALSEQITKAVKVLQEGGIIIFPTETIYGIGTALSNLAGVEKLFEIKKRPKDKPFQVLINSFNQLDTLVLPVKENISSYLKEHWPGPLTAILKKKETVSDLITAGLDTVGIRIPDHEIALKIISLLGEPLVATSANRAGEASATNIEEIQNISGIDFILDGGECEIKKASKIIDFTKDNFRVLR